MKIIWVGPVHSSPSVLGRLKVKALRNLGHEVTIFVNRKHLLTCRAAAPESLAEAILLLYRNQDLRRSIAHRGHALFRQRFTPEILGDELVTFLKNIVVR